jgi:hypothetical protein
MGPALVRFAQFLPNNLTKAAQAVANLSPFSTGEADADAFVVEVELGKL